MGCGIAQSIIVAGHDALLVDSAAGPLARARAAIEASLARAQQRGTLSADDAAATLARLTCSQTLAAVSEADVVIEAVPEDVRLKRALFAEVARYLGPAAIVATNTSAIRLSELADALPDPARFVGLHYFFPAAANRLLEVVRGRQTSEATFEAARAFALATKKLPLLCRDSSGFVVNRFFTPWLNEAVRLDDEGTERAAIERAGLESFGAPLGPFALMVATKTEIALHATTELAALGAFYEPAAGLARQVATGTEWTLPPTTASAAGKTAVTAGAPEPAVARAIPPAPVAADAPAASDPPELVGRLRAAVWFAVGQLLDEGVCDAAAIETGAAVGLRWTVSPLAALRADRAAGLRDVAQLARRYGAAAPESLATL